MPAFFACYYQLHSVWVSQAQQVQSFSPAARAQALWKHFPTSCTDRLHRGCLYSDPGVSQSPQLPLIVLAVYPACRFAGLAPTLLRRIAAGLACVLLAFVAGATLQFFIEKQPPAPLPIYYQVPEQSLPVTATVVPRGRRGLGHPQLPSPCLPADPAPPPQQPCRCARPDWGPGLLPQPWRPGSTR